MATETHLSTAEAAWEFSVETWQVRRIFETGELPEPPRIGIARAIPRTQLSDIELALRRRGYLSDESKATQPGAVAAEAAARKVVMPP